MKNEYFVVYEKEGGNFLEAYPLWQWDLGPLENLEEYMRHKYRYVPDVYFRIETMDMNEGKVTEKADQEPYFI